MKNLYPFTLQPLPYDYSALEPYIDTQTMQLHHDKHLQTYINNLNAVLENTPEYQSWPLEKLLTEINSLPPEIRTPIQNNGGGVFNHNLFFEIMTPNGADLKEGKLKDAIESSFGSKEQFEGSFKAAALKVFGSGYLYLVTDADGNLSLFSAANQETPLPNGLFPVITLDVWEHAYYLKFHNLRANFIDNWFKVLNYDQASANYQR